MRFLIESDYNKQIRSDVLAMINKQVNMDELSLLAVEEISTYLRDRYLVEKIFLNLQDYNAASSYIIDELVVHQDIIYIVLENVTGETPGTSNKFIVGDKRNPYIVTLTVDVALYHIHSRITPNAIPEIRDTRYKNAITWLNKVMMHKLHPDLPQNEAPTSIFVGGSNPKGHQTW